jgi:hypothetical protein
MTHPLFEKHRAKLDAALNAIHTRGYWAAYNEMPSPKPTAKPRRLTAKARFEAHLGKQFELASPAPAAGTGGEQSPYGIELNVQYPVCDIEALIAAGQRPCPAWQAAGAMAAPASAWKCSTASTSRASKSPRGDDDHRPGLDDGLSRPAHPTPRTAAWRRWPTPTANRSFVPAEATWEKPQGKNPPLVMKKHFEVVGPRRRRWWSVAAPSRPGTPTPACSRRWPPATR